MSNQNSNEIVCLFLPSSFFFRSPRSHPQFDVTLYVCCLSRAFSTFLSAPMFYEFCHHRDASSKAVNEAVEIRDEMIPEDLKAQSRLIEVEALFMASDSHRFNRMTYLVFGIESPISGIAAYTIGPLNSSPFIIKPKLNGRTETVS